MAVTAAMAQPNRPTTPEPADALREDKDALGAREDRASKSHRRIDVCGIVQCCVEGRHPDPVEGGVGPKFPTCESRERPLRPTPRITVTDMAAAQSPTCRRRAPPMSLGLAISASAGERTSGVPDGRASLCDWVTRNGRAVAARTFPAGPPVTHESAHLDQRRRSRTGLVELDLHQGADARSDEDQFEHDDVIEKGGSERARRKAQCPARANR